MQHLMGVEGVIVDLVKEISELVSDLTQPKEGDREEENIQVKVKPQFSKDELSFLTRLIPDLIHP